MKKFKLYFLLLIISVISLSFTAEIKEDCSILKNNKFTYKTGGKEALVVFKGDTYMEYHNKKKFFIKADISWVSDCEYYLIIKEATIPNFPFNPGTKMHIKVDKVRGKKVHYTSTLGGRSWEGKMTKTSKK